MLNSCPSCHHRGAIFRSFLRMNAQCPQCGYVFAREPGYFTGAVVGSYFMACASLVPTLVLCLLKLELEFPVVVAIALGQLVVLSPFMYRYSRLLWINIETRITRRLEARDLPKASRSQRKT